MENETESFLINGGYFHLSGEDRRCPHCKGRGTMFWVPSESKAFCVGCDKVSRQVSATMTARAHKCVRDLYFKKILEVG